MKLYSQDFQNIASLMYESHDLDHEFDDELDFDGAGGEFDEFGEFGDDVDAIDYDTIIEIEPTGSVEPVGGMDEELIKILLSDLKKLVEYGQRLKDLSKTVEFEPWMVAKITKASDYVSDVWHRLDVEADFANTGFEQAGPEQDLNF